MGAKSNTLTIPPAQRVRGYSLVCIFSTRMELFFEKILSRGRKDN